MGLDRLNATKQPATLMRKVSEYAYFQAKNSHLDLTKWLFLLF